MRKAVCLLVALLGVTGAVGVAQQPDRAQAVPGQYIVVFKDIVADVPGLAYGLAAAHGRSPRFIYERVLKGFAAELPEQAVEALSRNPNVAYIELDSVVWATATQSPATWGLDRIDQRALQLNNAYTYEHTGNGVTAYIIDTGIRVDHTDFKGRASSGYDAVDGGSADDCNGHGTHVAGTVGGESYGVAKDVHLVAVRVLNCSGSGTTSGVIAGIDWVTTHHTGPSIANMSLGGSASASLDTAVRNSIAAGISYAVSAGNNGRNACSFSPARVPEAMTIGATDSTDTKASWSNYGDCVDWFAPGVSITSAWYTSTTATNTISGTSMASPHAAGVAALYLQAYPAATPQQLRDALFDATSKGIVANSKTVNNHLLYSLFDSGTPANEPPTADFTFSTAGLTAIFSDTSEDSDGNIASRIWNFGDGGTSTLLDPSHTYSAAGTYGVTLTVSDDDGATSQVSKNVSVSDPTAGIPLTVTPRTAGTVFYADLRWSGASGAKVDVYRDGSIIISTANDGVYSNKIGKAPAPSYTYMVCEAGTSTCSKTVTVTF